jgi:hypothetical protein
VGLRPTGEPQHQFNMKNLQLTNLVYEMLIEVSKRRRMKPIDLITQIIETEYNKKK